MVEAFFTDSRYVKGSWVNWADVIFHELTGYNALMIFSNTILRKITSEGSSFTAREGTIVLGAVDFISSCFSILAIRKFQRRPMMILGHTGMTLAMISIGVLAIYEINIGVLVGMCVFICMYEMSTATLAWMYACETCSDQALGVCSTTLYTTILILTLTTEPLMDALPGDCDFFFLFASFNCVAACFLFFFLRETFGLTDNEKKELYAQK